MNELAAAAAGRLTLDVSYSRPLAGDRLGYEYANTGHVNIARLRRVLPSNNFRFYLCGPARMMESLVPALLEWGVPAAHIRYEAFGRASVTGLAGAAGQAPCAVQFARSGKSLRWTGEQESLLELAEQGGLRLESGCRAGSCGQCRVMLSAGRVTHVKPPGAALAEGECLACIARPVGDVIVEA
jgi:ferredoxin